MERDFELLDETPKTDRRLHKKDNGKIEVVKRKKKVYQSKEARKLQNRINKMKK